MGKNKDTNRIDIGENRKMQLFSEVDGICPLCTKPLMYKKGGKVFKSFEVAHIYPLNPTTKEIEVLKGVETLNEDVNDNDNLIALCTECHTKFDKEKTIEDYEEMVELKKMLITKNKIYNFTYENKIEDDIRHVLKTLTEEEFDMKSDLQFNARTIDEKLDDTIVPLTKRRIKEDVSFYYPIIKEKFKELDELNSNTSDIILKEVNLCYLKFCRECSTQESIFKSLVNWLNKRTNEYSVEACKIVIAFCIQNCEVFK